MTLRTLCSWLTLISFTAKVTGLSHLTWPQTFGPLIGFGAWCIVVQTVDGVERYTKRRKNRY